MIRKSFAAFVRRLVWIVERPVRWRLATIVSSSTPVSPNTATACASCTGPMTRQARESGYTPRCISAPPPDSASNIPVRLPGRTEVEKLPVKARISPMAPLSTIRFT